MKWQEQVKTYLYPSQLARMNHKVNHSRSLELLLKVKLAH